MREKERERERKRERSCWELEIGRNGKCRVKQVSGIEQRKGSDITEGKMKPNLMHKEFTSTFEIKEHAQHPTTDKIIISGIAWLPSFTSELCISGGFEG